MPKFILAVHQQPKAAGRSDAWAAVGSDFIGPLYTDVQVNAELKKARPGHYLILEGDITVVTPHKKA